MRRLLTVVFVVLALPLIGAAPSAFYAKPTVMVYPFVTSGSSVDHEASSRLATVIATQMANTGLVTVTPAPPGGTDRKEYLGVARAHNADYYVAGYISPLGTGVSVVEQVVSTTTGIIVFSQSAQLSTYEDAAGQGDDLAQFISRHANRMLATIPTPPPQSTSPSPAPSSGPEANLGKLFGRRKKPNTTPAPTQKPQPFAVVAVEGPADAALREQATLRLLSRTNGERAQNATTACAAHAVRAVLAGTLTVRPSAQPGGSSASFDLSARDCAGKTIWHELHSSDASGAQAQQVAMERAVDAALGAYLNPPKRRR